METIGSTSQFGWEGDEGVGERLIQQILRGEKTATASPKALYNPQELAELRASVGRLLTIIDKHDRPRCTIRQLAVFETTYGEPDPRLVAGEVCADAAEFRREHAHVWDDLFEKAGIRLQDETVLIAELFELVESIPNQS
ncbi:MAG: ASCH domain-containing protein [Elusimicrobiota bacterium]